MKNCEHCQSPAHNWLDCPKKPVGWRPERLTKKSTAARKDVRGAHLASSGDTQPLGNSGRPLKSEAGTQALPVDTNYTPDLQPVSTDSSGPKGFEVTPQLGAKFDKKAWMREYMREHRRGIRRRKNEDTGKAI